MFLFKDIIVNVYCWFINIELTTNSTITHTLTKLIKQRVWYFLHNAHHILCLQTLDCMSTLHLGSYWTTKSPKKTERCKKIVALNRPQKRMLAYSMRADIRRQNIALLELSWKSACQVTHPLYTYPPKTRKELHVLIWGLKIHFSE